MLKTRKSFFFAVTLMACFSVQCSSSDEETNDIAASDVSFLIGMLSVQDFRAQTIGGHGSLLPRVYFDELEGLTRIDEPDVIYKNLDVVGVRIDPCFRENMKAEQCDSQIRFVFQPVIGEESDVEARDASVHAFYEVPLSELHSLSAALTKLRLSIQGSTLIGEHPLPNEAVMLLLPHVGASRLSRLTFVSVHASEQAWSFGGFDVIDGELHQQELVGVDGHEQHLTSLGGVDTLDATILPEPMIETEAMQFMERYLREAMSNAEMSSAHDGLSRILNPESHDSGTVDCASCHMATTTAYFVDGRLGLSIPDVYSNTQNQRMFGFFGTEASISPRVTAETRAIVASLNRQK
jgi:hypothetical protein